MVDLRLFDIQNLLEMLARQTKDYTQLLTENKKGEIFENCKQTIELIQQELYSRHIIQEPLQSACRR